MYMVYHRSEDPRGQRRSTSLGPRSLAIPNEARRERPERPREERSQSAASMRQATARFSPFFDTFHMTFEGFRAVSRASETGRERSRSSRLSSGCPAPFPRPTGLLVVGHGAEAENPAADAWRCFEASKGHLNAKNSRLEPLRGALKL